MGFLSKLFGGDAGDSPAKEAAEPAPSSPESPPAASTPRPASLRPELAAASPEPPRSAPPATAGEAADATDALTPVLAPAAERVAPGAGRLEAAAPPPPRRAPDSPRRRPPESSIITSAPVPPPPRAAAPGARSGPEPPAEGGLFAGRRREHVRSPGFYSNVSAAHRATLLEASKRTVLGVAPPAEPPPPESPPAAARPGPRASGPAPESVAPSSPLPALAQETEDTSPGLGVGSSRHDPAVRPGLPERDLELLVDFVMDLGLGLASEDWLGPARGAVQRLQAAARDLRRSALDKALQQLSAAIEASDALAEPHRARITQALVRVDLTLPRPIDVPGQRLIRERLIVRHLLSELSASYPRVAEHLEQAGLSLERLASLAPEALAADAGVSVELAAQALAALGDYLRERARRGPQLSLLGKARALEERLAELEAAAELFERFADDDDPGKKRRARRSRQSALARLSLFLAERGEATILGELERCSVQGKIARLRRWLSEQAPGSARAGGADLPIRETTG